MRRAVLAVVAILRFGVRAAAWLLGAAYGLVVRVALWIGLAIGLLHFGIDAPETARRVSDLISESIDGELRMGRIHASPLLKSWVVADVRITDRHGAHVIRADRVSFDLRRRALVAWLLRLVGGEAVVDLHAERVEVRRSHTRVDVRHDVVPIADLWDAPPHAVDDGDDGEGMAVHIQLDRIRLRDAAVEVLTGATTVGAQGVEIRGDMTIADGGVDIRGRSVKAREGSLRFAALPDLGALAIAGFTARDAQVTGDRLEIREFGADVSAVKVHGRGRLSFEGAMGVQALLRADGSFENGVLRQLLPIEGTGPVSVVADVRGDLERPEIEADAYMEDVRFRQVALNQASGHLSVQVDPVIADTLALRISHLRFRTDRGTVRLSDFGGALDLSTGVALRGSGRLDLWRLRPLELLANLDLAAAPADFPALILDGHLDIDFSGGGDGWTFGQTLAIAARLGDRPPVRLRGPTVVATDAGGLALTLRDVTLTDESLDLRLGGTARFPEGAVDARARGTIHRLSAAALPFARIPVEAALERIDLRATGHLPVPELRLDARVRDLEAAGAPTLGGELRARLGSDGVIRVATMRVAAPDTTAELSGSLALFRPGQWAVRARPTLSLERLRGRTSLSSDWLDLPVRGLLEVDASDLRMELFDPLTTVRGTIRARGRHLSWQTFDVKEVTLRAHGRPERLEIDAFEARLADGAVVSLQGALRGLRGEADLQAEISGLRLDQLPPLFGRTTEDWPLRGAVEGRLQLRGPLDAPQISGRVHGVDVGWARYHLGPFRLSLSPLPQGGARLVSLELPGGLQIEAPSALSLEPGRRGLVLAVDLHDARPLQFVGRSAADATPMALPLELVPTIRGHVRVTVPFDEPIDPEPLVRVWIPDGGLHLRGGDLVEPIRNVGPVDAAYAWGDLRVPLLKLEYSGVRLRTCAVLRGDGALAAAAHGSVPLTLLALSRELVSEAGGMARIEGPEGAAVPADLLSTCPPEMIFSEATPLMVQGPLTEPVIEGRVVLSDALVALRGMSQELFLAGQQALSVTGRVDGGHGRVAVSTEGDGGLDLRFGEGRAQIVGELTLRDLAPDTLALQLRGSEIEFASPGEFRVTANPDVRVIGANLSDPASRDLQAQGRVAIVEGTYSKSFNAFAQAVGNVFGRQMDTYSGSLLDAVPLLKELGLDLLVTASAFRMASEFPVGEVDLELDINAQVRGTVENLRIRDQVRVRPGSRLTYSILEREFEINEGTIEFTGDPAHPILNIAARSRIEYEDTEDERAGLGEFEKVVFVTIRITGVYPELQVAFESDDPTLDQADIQALILTGAKPAGNGTYVGGIDVADVSRYLNSVLLDALVLGVNEEGGWRVKAMVRLGEKLRLRARVEQGIETRYDTGFVVRFTDLMFLEGRLKVQQRDINPTSTYEAKLKARFGLDE